MGTLRCDRCQEGIQEPEHLHYRITIEIEAQGYIDESEVDSSEDQLLDIESLLESADQVCSADFGDEWYQKRDYLLCKSCYSGYIVNPLGKLKR